MMLEFPPSAEFGQSISNARLMKHGLKARLGKMVKAVVWAYKLAPSTVNLAATESVKEVEVLDLTLRGDGDRPRNLALIIEALAKMIPNPCVYRLFGEDGDDLGAAVCPKVSGGALYGDSPVYRMARENQYGDGVSRRDAETQRGLSPRENNLCASAPLRDEIMPWSGVTTLEALLMRVAASFADMTVVPGEALKDFIARHYRIEALRGELEIVEKKLARETQLDVKYQLSKERQRILKEIG